MSNKGKWVATKVKGYGDFKVYVCSLCGSFIPCNMNSTFDFSNFCPNCGASMEVEHEEV